MAKAKGTGAGIGLSVTGSDPNAKKPGGGLFVQGPQPSKTKAELLREWFADKPDGLKFSDVKGDIEKLFTSKGHTFNENSDYLAFRTQGVKAGKLTAGKSSGTKTTKAKAGYGFADFISEAVESEIDSDVLAQVIKIIAKCGSTEVAEKYATRWDSVLKLMGGDATKAQEAVALFSGE